MILFKCLNINPINRNKVDIYIVVNFLRLKYKV